MPTTSQGVSELFKGGKPKRSTLPNKKMTVKVSTTKKIKK